VQLLTQVRAEEPTRFGIQHAFDRRLGCLEPLIIRFYRIKRYRKTWRTEICTQIERKKDERPILCVSLMISSGFLGMARNRMEPEEALP
jgi:hypothetical protein